MKVYIAYIKYGMSMTWKVDKVFRDEAKAKAYCAEQNGKVFQEFDSYGLTQGEEFNYFEADVIE